VQSMILKTAAVAAALFTLGCAGVPGNSNGVSEARLRQMGEQVRADVETGRIPGAVIVVARNGNPVYTEAIGVLDPKSGAPMRMDAIFRVYSMTKPIVSVGIMMLVEEGRLQLADPASKYLPELKGLKVGVEKKDASGRTVLEEVPAQREMTVQDLLRHTSGLTYGVFGKSLVKDAYNSSKMLSDDQSNAEMVAKLGKLPLAYQPGTTWDYSMSTDVLGALIERVSGRTLDAFLSQKILMPLGMKDTGFWVEPSQHGRIAEPFAVDPDSKQAVTLTNVHQPRRWLSGGGGMVSTASDYLRFSQMLLNGGALDGVRIVSRKTVEYMASDHLGLIRGPAYAPGPGYGFGLGFAVRTAAGQSAVPGSPGEHNWGGFGGTAFWIDPQEKLIAIWMMQAPNQRTYYRALFRNYVYSALD